MKTKLLFFVLLLTLIGCRKEFKADQGRIPQEYLAQAQAFVGQYQGEFQGYNGVLELSLVEDKPVLKFLGEKGSDILGNNCNSAIGDLLAVTVDGKKNNYKIVGARFSFDANLCSKDVEGKNLILEFDKKSNGSIRADVSIKHFSYIDQNCREEILPPPNNGSRYVCNPKEVEVFLRGRFTKAAQ